MPEITLACWPHAYTSDSIVAAIPNSFWIFYYFSIKSYYSKQVIEIALLA